jgi:hypothetical protein
MGINLKEIYIRDTARKDAPESLGPHFISLCGGDKTLWRVWIDDSPLLDCPRFQSSIFNLSYCNFIFPISPFKSLPSTQAVKFPRSHVMSDVRLSISVSGGNATRLGEWNTVASLDLIWLITVSNAKVCGIGRRRGLKRSNFFPSLEYPTHRRFRIKNINITETRFRWDTELGLCPIYHLLAAYIFVWKLYLHSCTSNEKIEHDVQN